MPAPQTPITRMPITRHRLAQLIRAYRAEGEIISKAEGRKKELGDEIIALMRKLKINEEQTGDLRAMIQTRMTRKYRLTREFADLLLARKVSAFVPAKPIDEAIGAGKLSVKEVQKVVEIEESSPYIDVRQVKGGGLP